MELTKTKFKQTEVGLIPDDWQLRELKDIVSNIIDNRGKTPPLSKTEEIELIETASISFVRQYPDYRKISKFVSRVTFDIWFRNHPKINDILVSTVGEYSGASAIIRENRGTIAQNLIALRIIKSHPKYVFNWTRSEIFNKQLKAVMMGHAQPSLRVPWLLKFQIPLPPSIDEQKAIATALSDVDELITKLEKLIEKKKAIKQGAMQALLTPPHKGGKRLGGFSGEWVEKNLGDFCSLITKGTTPTSLGREFTTSGVNFIKAESISPTGHVLRDKVAFIDDECHDLLSRSKLRSGDLLFTIAGVLGRIGLVLDENLPANTNQAVAIIRLDLQKSVSKSFIFHTLRSKYTMHHIESISVQGAQANFSLNDLNNLPIQIPTDIKEQEEIASVLSILDSEVLKMVSKLDKLFKIKQGMMQELLTGRTRLV